MGHVPDHETGRWQDQLKRGIDAFRDGRASAAVTLLEAANRSQPDHFEIRYWLANACRLQGDVGRAEVLFKQLLAADEGSEQAAFGLAFLLRDQARLDEAEATLTAFVAQAAVTPDARLRVVGFLRDINRFHGAIEVMKAALGHMPADGAAHLRLARLLQATGQFEEALEQVRSALRYNPQLGGAWISLAQLQRFSDPDQADLVWIKSSAAQLQSEESRMCHGFALAKALDDIGDYEAAWKQYAGANARAAARLAWRRLEWDAVIARKLQADPGEKTAIRTAPSPTALFIVGMLRSGTTLLEQQLGRHVGVQARGELNFLAHFDREALPPATARRELWAHLQQGDRESCVFIDKNPLNFRYLDTLKAVEPSARVVHIRRDGRNSGLSCFTQLFQHPDAAFANRLDDIVHVYRDYRRLMAHWHAVAPGWILEIDYEDLVNDTRRTLDTVLEHIGLPPGAPSGRKEGHEGIVRTASAWQARQAIHADSLERWKNYRNSASEFFDRIAEIDIEFDRG